jgi:hypothetical protein
MSKHVESLVWEVAFPTSTQKLLMLRVADYADDDGQGVYPSIAEVARQTGASERQVQYAIRSLETCGLLERVQDGGTKDRRTNVWRVNVDLLARLALQELVLQGTYDSLEAVENEGAIIAPRTLARVQFRAERVRSAAGGGAARRTQTLTEPELEPLAREGARATESAARPRLRVPRLVTASDDEWPRWLNWLSNDGKHSAREQFEAEGEMVVFQPYPSADADDPKLAPLEGSPKRAELMAKRVPNVRNPAGADA